MHLFLKQLSKKNISWNGHFFFIDCQIYFKTKGFRPLMIWTKGSWRPWIAHLSHFPHKIHCTFLLFLLFQFVTPSVGPVLTPGASYGKKKKKKKKKKQEGHDGPVSLHWLILGYFFKTLDSEEGLKLVVQTKRFRNISLNKPMLNL